MKSTFQTSMMKKGLLSYLACECCFRLHVRRSKGSAKKESGQTGGETDLSAFGRAYGNRTRDSSVKGRCLNPLTNAPFRFIGAQK